MLLALAFRPGQAPARLTAALATPLATRVELDQLSEDEAAALLGDLDRGALAAIYRHGGGNPFYLEQLAQASTAGSARRRRRGRGGRGGPAGGRGLAGRGARRPVPDGRERCSKARRSPASRSSPTSRRRSPSSTDAEALAALDELLERDCAPDRGSAPVHLPPSARAPRGLRGHRRRRRLAAHARAASGLAARGAAATERAHHVEQAAGPGDEEAIEILLEAAEAASARAGGGRPLVRGGSAPAGATTTARQVDVRVALASALRCDRRARAVPRDAAGGDRAARRRGRSRAGSS